MPTPGQQAPWQQAMPSALQKMWEQSEPDLASEIAADSARYRWLRHNSGYSIRCSLFGEVGMHEHKDADLDALIDAQMTPNDKGKRTPEARSAGGGPLDPPVLPLLEKREDDHA